MWEMEVQSSQDNLKAIREVKLRIKQTELRMWSYKPKGTINVYSIE